MILSVVGDSLIFSVFSLGLGVLFATFIRKLGALDRLCLGIGAAVGSLYLTSFTIYLLHLPPVGLWLLAGAGFAASLIRNCAIQEFWQDKAVQGAFLNWPILAAWCLGWHALVFSYSGGRWAGDWQEHYDRVHFFLQHWPADQVFIGAYHLPARPPLPNLVISGFLGLVGGKFFHFQVFSTLLATLVYFPLASLVHRLRAGPQPQALLLGLLMLSPLFVQHATFPWTKLPVAYFLVLAADLLTRRTDAPGRFLAVALVALAAALVTHYSAAVWIIALGLAWLAVHGRRLSEPAIRRALLLGGAAGMLLFLTWLGWSLKTYGPGLTFSISATTGLEEKFTGLDRLGNILGNIYRTLVPAWLWEGLPAELAQPDQLARLRDRWFCLYQLNLPFAFGLGGLLMLGRLLPALPAGETTRFWWLAASLAVAVNAVVHQPEPLGLTHLALVPLVLLGLAWLAAGAHTLPAAWRRLWVLGLALDFGFGLALHFGVQSLWLDRWLHPGRTDLEHILQLSQPAASNYFGKLRIGATHLADDIPPAVALLVLAASAVLALRAWRTSAEPRSS